MEGKNQFQARLKPTGHPDVSQVLHLVVKPGEANQGGNCNSIIIYSGTRIMTFDASIMPNQSNLLSYK